MALWIGDSFYDIPWDLKGAYMTKAPIRHVPVASRAKALAGMNKAELIRTVKTLDKRVTKLLNELAAAKEPSTKPLLMEAAPEDSDRNVCVVCGVPHLPGCTMLNSADHVGSDAVVPRRTLVPAFPWGSGFVNPDDQEEN